MAKKLDKQWINCAITGSIHTPTMTPHLPITPEEIAQSAIGAAEAGAATVHLHVRTPETGKPISDMELFKEVCTEIKKNSNVVQCLTTGGGLGMTAEERVKVVSIFEPELASMNMGSFNFGLFPALEKMSDFEHKWEREYLEFTRDFVFTNTFKSMETFLNIMKEHGTKPEMECYDIGHLYNAAFLAERGYMEKPFFLQFIMGITGAIQPSVDNLLHYKNTADKLFGDDYVWSVLPVGRHQFPLGTVAAVMGGTVRVGLEDNIYIGKGSFSESNAMSVEKIKGIMSDGLNIPLGDADYAREILQLKGLSNTKI